MSLASLCLSSPRPHLEGVVTVDLTGLRMERHEHTKLPGVNRVSTSYLRNMVGEHSQKHYSAQFWDVQEGYGVLSHINMPMLPSEASIMVSGLSHGSHGRPQWETRMHCNTPRKGSMRLVLWPPEFFLQQLGSLSHILSSRETLNAFFFLLVIVSRYNNRMVIHETVTSSK